MLEKFPEETSLTLNIVDTLLLPALTDVPLVLQKFDCPLVVDEVMTCGRVDGFLHSLSLGIQPEYIALGKWLQAGVVLRHVQCNSTTSLNQYLQEEGAGDSIAASIIPAQRALRAMTALVRKGSLKNIVSSAREGVCAELKKMLPAGELVVWGAGAMVFANVDIPRPEVVKLRFLPMLVEEGTVPREWKFYSVNGMSGRSAWNDRGMTKRNAEANLEWAMDNMSAMLSAARSNHVRWQ